MDKEKLKKGRPKRNRLAFLALWLFGHGMAWSVFYAITDAFNVFGNDLVEFVTAGIIVGGITSLTQYALIRWQFGRNIKAWIPASLVAWIFAAVVPFQYLVDFSPLGRSFNGAIEIAILALALYAPPALVQVWLLRKHVQQAWLWGLSSIAGTALFGMGLEMMGDDSLGVAMSYGLYASATALTLLWLFVMSQQPQALKETGHAEKRLSDADTQIQKPEIIDEQTARQSTLR